MTFNEEENFAELKITSYSTEEGLDYMTIQHVKTGICLGSEPVIRDDINSYDENIQKRIIREDTKIRLMNDIQKLAKDLLV